MLAYIIIEKYRELPLLFVLVKEGEFLYYINFIYYLSEIGYINNCVSVIELRFYVFNIE